MKSRPFFGTYGGLSFSSSLSSATFALIWSSRASILSRSTSGFSYSTSSSADEKGVGVEGRADISVVRAHLFVDQPELAALELWKEVPPNPAREVIGEATAAVFLPHQGPRVLVEPGIIASPDLRWGGLILRGHA